MFLGYAQNNTSGTYQMLNIRTKHIILSCEVMWLEETYGEYVSRKENTKADSNILQNEYEFYKWAHVKIDPVKNEVNTENLKTEENVKTKQYSNKEVDLQNTAKRVSFTKQENKVKQYHHEDIEKNVILALKKLDTSYNPASLNYTNDKLKGIKPE